MKYSELIRFDPIESVIQLRDADHVDEARRLVSSFVASNGMIEQLTGVVFPNLQFVEQYDRKGLLIVGNYGTGKSHLMAVITGFCENSALVAELRNQKLRDATGSVAGRFKVIRSEIGAVTMPLRDIVIRELERGLRKFGVDYRFPLPSETTGYKEPIMDMMQKFSEVYPEQGLIFALDELLDYLRGRDEQALINDLIFLRELGEVCGRSRFRFIAGIQEALFDNPRFHFVSQSILKVRDRYQEVHIVRTDIEFVVAERLLKKNVRQKALVREHLEKFASLYYGMTESMERFVGLYPVHPSFIETFERISFAEKREVLKSTSLLIQKMLEKEVPTDDTGLISYDSYWDTLKGTQSFRAVPSIGEVVEKSERLEALVSQNLPRAHYKPMALRIIYALSVHRLTTGDINNPLGLTTEQLKDQMCLGFPAAVPQGQATSEFLNSNVEMVIQQIIKTVSGQYISCNTDNRQYYLDLKKDIDYDQLIRDKAESLSEGALDRAYYYALARVMEVTDSTAYVQSRRIWEYEVNWFSRNVTRRGYLFFGEPNERSTAQPPRDFYVYFLPIFKPESFVDEKKADEVFFRLIKPPKEIEEAVRLLAGARELAALSSGQSRTVYSDKAEQKLTEVTKWLVESFGSTFEVTYIGTTDRAGKWLKGSGQQLSFRESANLVSSRCLEPHFEELAPDYPNFNRMVTLANREELVKDTLNGMRRGFWTQNGKILLDGLELVDDQSIKPERSRYAKYILTLFKGKQPGQVINRVELFEGEVDAQYDRRFRLEPDLFSIVLVALAMNGDIVLALSDRKINAANLEELARIPMQELSGFKFIELPKGFPLDALKSLMELLKLPTGLVVTSDTREEGVRRMQEDSRRIAGYVAEALNQLRDGIGFWGFTLVEQKQREKYEPELTQLKEFLDSLNPYNTPGKLSNFRYSVIEVRANEDRIRILEEIRELDKLSKELMPLASHLSQAELVLPEGHQWLDELAEKKVEVDGWVKNRVRRSEKGFGEEVSQKLRLLKEGYLKAYITLHERARLNASDDDKKGRLVKDPRMVRLNSFREFELFPKASLLRLQKKLDVKTCFSLVAMDLEQRAVCPHCGFQPRIEQQAEPAKDALGEVDEGLDQLHAEWESKLIENLEDPMVKGNLGLLKEKDRKLVEDLVSKRKLPEKVDDALVSTLRQVLSGLEKVDVSVEMIVEDLTRGGMPCSLSDYKSRFDEHLRKLAKGREQSKVRVVIEG